MSILMMVQLQLDFPAEDKKDYVDSLITEGILKVI